MIRQAVDGAVLVLAAARLTRLVTEDKIGVWYFRDPIEAWGARHEIAVLEQATQALQETPADEQGELADMVNEYDDFRPWSWQARVAAGASCRWCVGFWLGGLLMLGDVLTRTTVFGWARPVWRFGLGVLALNAASNAVGRWAGTLS